MLKDTFISGLFIFCSVLSVAEQNTTTDYPSVELSNDIIKVSVYLPDSQKGYYRGTRFDWSGVISQVEYDGHTYFGEWKQTHDPNNHDDITGPVEEFRSGSFDKPSALGYDQAQVGETFIKIGVGLLEKPEEPDYRFWNAYKIVRPGEWKVEYGKDWIEFNQDFDGENGWHYQYTKKIILSKDMPEFTISHRLKNIGEKTIETSQYNHNFFIIDNETVGKNYILRFPFDVKTMRDLSDTIEANGKEIVFKRDLKQESIFTELEGFGNTAGDYEITIENIKTGAGVLIKGDVPLVHFNFWAIDTTICPEPFIDASLAVGEEKEWNITYSIFVKNKKMNDY